MQESFWRIFHKSIWRKIFIRVIPKFKRLIVAGDFGSWSRDSRKRARCKMRLFISPETSERSNFHHLKGRHKSINIQTNVAIVCSKFGSIFLREKVSSILQKWMTRFWPKAAKMLQIEEWLLESKLRALFWPGYFASQVDISRAGREWKFCDFDFIFRAGVSGGHTVSFGQGSTFMCDNRKTTSGSSGGRHFRGLFGKTLPDSAFLLPFFEVKRKRQPFYSL